MPSTHTKPRIAVPIPTSANAEYNERCWPEYAAALEAVGGDPVRVALDLDPSEAAKLISSTSAILLPGSPADVHAQKYGQEPHPQAAAPDRMREATDELLLQDAFNLRKPLLGICFGLQMINVWRGGSLVQHLATAQPHAPSETHPIDVQPDAPLLRSFFLDQFQPKINSSHHQAVDRPGDGLRVAARSSTDGVVEALEGIAPDNHFLLGVQWHPERVYTQDEAALQLFSAFVAAAHRWHLPHA